LLVGIYASAAGSILAPSLIALGSSVYEVVPATLAATFLTSIAQIGSYRARHAVHGPTIARRWILAAFPGAGGLAGIYCGARLQALLPERSLGRLLGLIACVVAVRYLQSAVTAADRRRSAEAVAHRRVLNHGQPVDAAGGVGGVSGTVRSP
jgi:uncharacterized membrane protein YfcA